jgi:hypothetical protein
MNRGQVGILNRTKKLNVDRHQKSVSGYLAPKTTGSHNRVGRRETFGLPVFFGEDCVLGIHPSIKQGDLILPKEGGPGGKNRICLIGKGDFGRDERWGN